MSVCVVLGEDLKRPLLPGCVWWGGRLLAAGGKGTSLVLWGFHCGKASFFPSVKYYFKNICPTHTMKPSAPTHTHQPRESVGTQPLGKRGRTGAEQVWRSPQVGTVDPSSPGLLQSNQAPSSSKTRQCKGLDREGCFWPSVSWDLGPICKKVLEYLPVTRTAICPLLL